MLGGPDFDEFSRSFFTIYTPKMRAHNQNYEKTCKNARLQAEFELIQSFYFIFRCR